MLNIGELGLDESALLSAIADDLENLYGSIPWDCIDEYEDGEGGPCVDVRLRIHSGSWQVLWGDPQFDTDHRGRWGYGTLFYGYDNREDMEGLAKEMLQSLY